MTDKKLIQALRAYSCQEWTIPNKAADRLEVLLAENERLKAQLPKWISVEERLPETEPETIIWGDPDEAYTYETSQTVLVVNSNGEMWLDRYISGPLYDGWTRYRSKRSQAQERVSHWMPLPSTEGVE